MNCSPLSMILFAILQTNGVPVIPIKPSALLSFFRPCLGRGMVLRINPNKCLCPTVRNLAFHGPNILLRTIQNSVYPTVLSYSVATHRVCNGS